MTSTARTTRFVSTGTVRRSRSAGDAGADAEARGGAPGGIDASDPPGGPRTDPTGSVHGPDPATRVNLDPAPRTPTGFADPRHPVRSRSGASHRPHRLGPRAGSSDKSEPGSRPSYPNGVCRPAPPGAIPKRGLACRPHRLGPRAGIHGPHKSEPGSRPSYPNGVCRPATRCDPEAGPRTDPTGSVHGPDPATRVNLDPAPRTPTGFADPPPGAIPKRGLAPTSPAPHPAPHPASSPSQNPRRSSGIGAVTLIPNAGIRTRAACNACRGSRSCARSASVIAPSVNRTKIPSSGP